MTGIVDVGGGMRGIYSAGIFDYCLKKGMNFDLLIGISAGSANMASFLSKQPGRNYEFYCSYAFREEYMGMEQLVKTGSFINFSYIYDVLSRSDGENPFDYKAFAEDSSRFIVIATDANTGMPKYFTKADIRENCYDVLKASCCIPGINRPIIIDGVPYFDGALSDTIPIKKAFSEGCDKVILILTKPVDHIRRSAKDKVLSKMIQKAYPQAAKKFEDRAGRYNLYVKLAKKYQQEGKLLILAPDSVEGLDTLKRDKNALHLLYQKGMADAEKIEKFLSDSI